MAYDKKLSEDETWAKFITPAVRLAGWDEAFIRRQVPFVKDRIIERGSLGTPIQLIQPFGAKAGFEQAAHEMQTALYQDFQQNVA